MALAWRVRTSGRALAASLFVLVAPGCSIIAGLHDWREAPGGGGGDAGPGGGRDGSIPGDSAPSEDAPVNQDAESQDATKPDVVQTGCDLTKPFKAPVALVDLNSTDTDAFARLSSDELTVYLETTRNGGASKIFRSIRANRASAFPPPVPLPEADLGGTNEFAPSVSPDGLLFFMHVTDGVSAKALYSTTRATTTVPFDPPTSVLIPAPARHPYVVSGGFFYVAGAEGGPYNIVFAKFTNPFTLSPVGFQNAPANGFSAPVVSPDKLVFYGSANGRIWRAERASDGDPFSPPVEMIELNDVAADQFPDWISADGCRLYFHRTGAVSTGVDIYLAEKPAK